MLDFTTIPYWKEIENLAESLSWVKKTLGGVFYIFSLPAIKRYFSDLTSFREVVWKLTLEI